GQQVFEWTGRVDREVQISMRGNQISTRNIGGAAARERSRVFTPLPRQDGRVVAQLESGRGNVDVIQQPSQSNGWTTVVRVRDTAGGAGTYRVAAYWESYANGEYIGRDRGRGRGVYGNGGNRGNGQYGNGNSMLHWTGNVDGLLEIRIQNGRVSYRTLSGAQPTAIRANTGNVSIPRGSSSVSVEQNQGRGSVSVVQQPSSYNGYTTVLRVNDPQSGSSYYDFDLYWR
ncbi:MAG: hypothetical protein ACRENC_14660, partial [Gemmatimonadaceae bacterium]